MSDNEMLYCIELLSVHPLLNTGNIRILIDIKEGILRSPCMLSISTTFPLWKVPAYVLEVPAMLLAICQPISVISTVYISVCIHMHICIHVQMT